MSDHCLNCGVALLKTRAHIPYAIGGLSFVILTNCIVKKCNKCRDEMPVFPNPESLMITIVGNILIQPFPLNHEAIRFLRRAMGFNSEEFAALLCTTRVEVSRWENGKARISGLTDLRLRREVVDKLLPPREGHAGLLEDITRVMTKSYKTTAKQVDVFVDAGPHYGRYASDLTTETALTATK